MPPHLSSKYRYYSHRVYHRLRNYIVADLHVAIAGGIRTIDYVGRAGDKLPRISRGIVQVFVGHVMANRARDPVTRQRSVRRGGILQLIAGEIRAWCVSFVQVELTLSHYSVAG